MKAQTMRRVRQLHNYVAIFFAPAIIFFAFSGALQTLGLHESHDPARPPVGWVRWIATVHKDQRVPAAQAPARPAAHAPGGDHREAPSRKESGPSPVPLKAFVTLLALGLIVSSGLGVTIALNNPLMRRTSLALLGAGTIVPILLLFV
jgi:hypothetical protein